jgi:hypothetical protein
MAMHPRLLQRTVRLSVGACLLASATYVAATAQAAWAVRETHLAPTTATTGTSATSATATGTVTGVVTDTHGHPLRGICVVGLARSPFPATNSSGVYTIKLRPGTYHQMWFAPGCGSAGTWLMQRHTNGKFPYKPAPVVVTAGHTVRINARLSLGGEISGQVTGRGGKRLAGICLQIYQPFKHYVASPNFGNEGLITSSHPFRLTSVPPGHWRILFFPTTCGTTGDYASQWWKDALDIKSAKVVTIRPGTVVSGVDQQLPAGAVITGQVTGTGGVPLASVCVDLSSPRRPDILDIVSTGSNGRYRAQALTTGRYTVMFDPSCIGPANTYQGQSYPGTVKVTNGKVTSGINAQLTLNS